MTALVPFSFHGDQLPVARLDDGDVGVPLRRLCEVLGLDDDAQRRRLIRNAEAGARWACTSVMTVQVDGQGREMVFLPRTSIPMWAATVDIFRVSEEVRPKLLAYQDEVAAVLAEHFLGGRARGSLEERVARLERALEGRRLPRVVKAMTPEEELVRRFLAEPLPTDPIFGKRFYGVFAAWCERNGHEPLANNVFARYVLRSGLYTRHKIEAGMRYQRLPENA